MSQNISWDDIEAAMSTFVPTNGGFSLAKRGIVTLEDGDKVFVKLATDEDSRQFINKEIVAYEWLKKKGYKHMPSLLLSKDGGLVLPDLSAYDWSSNWTEQKLNAVLGVLDDLNNVSITKEDRENLRKVVLVKGWQRLLEEPKYMSLLIGKLKDQPDIAAKIEGSIKDFASHTEAYYADTSKTVLIHADVRADNLAYNQKTGEVLLVDWNWMGLGQRGIEDIGLLVNVAKSGFDVKSFCPERIEEDAALVLAGFWLFHCTEEIWEGGDPALRDLQFESGLQALRWAI